MNKEKREALEAAGFVFGEAEDFLKLTEEERRLVELRLAVSRAVRARRRQQNLTQAEAAKKLKSSQSRVAKLEAGSADVSLDLMFRGLFVLGGSIRDIRIGRKAAGSKVRVAAKATAATGRVAAKAKATAPKAARRKRVPMPIR
jgi:transcriptional regulator with XRE-family HTH domain